MKSNNEYALERDIEIMRTQLAEAREEAATAGRNAKHYADKCIELEATVERMMEAFRRIMTTDKNGNLMKRQEIFRIVRPFVTATPAANVAWIKAKALLGLKPLMEICGDNCDEVVYWSEIEAAAHDLLNPAGEEVRGDQASDPYEVDA
jgi:hypothetical protein